MAKKKMELKAGIKYRGYALLNEFGEIDFIPEQTGAREGQIKLLCEGENYKVSTTEKKIIVHLTIEKCSGLELMRKLYNRIGEISTKLKDYEF